MANEKDRILGPYNNAQMDVLEKLEAMEMDLIGKIFKSTPKIENDVENISVVLNLMKEVANNVHKTATNVSKHDIGNAIVATAEDRMAAIRNLHKLQHQAYEDTEDRDMYDIPKELMIDPVPGQLFDGIDKPTLKEIMAVNIMDEEDD